MSSQFRTEARSYWIYGILDEINETAYVGKSYAKNPKKHYYSHMRGEHSLTCDDYLDTFDYMHLQTGRGTVEFSYCSAEMLLNLIQRIGSERVKICMDTGHANIAGKNLPAMIHQFGSELKTLHINDNYGLLGPVYPDFHLFPGYGTVCWEPVFQALKEVGFEGALNLEPTLLKAPHAIHVSRLRAAREIVTIMAEQAGLKAE